MSAAKPCRYPTCSCRINASPVSILKRKPSLPDSLLSRRRSALCPQHLEAQASHLHVSPCLPAQEAEQAAACPDHVTILEPRILPGVSAKQAAAEVAAMSELILVHTAELLHQQGKSRKSVLLISKAAQGVAREQGQSECGTAPISLVLNPGS